ncbi:MAG TPA: HNH endonuclease, partial [Vicinamibacteria bacterium]|nr:HNH endonuclease [Vicinamibacteria bacterium]
MSTAALSHLSDRDLLAEVSRLATGQRDATVSLIAHLAELHARRLHQRAGFSSLYTYCLEELHLSE